MRVSMDLLGGIIFILKATEVSVPQYTNWDHQDQAEEEELLPGSWTEMAFCKRFSDSETRLWIWII